MRMPQEDKIRFDPFHGLPQYFLRSLRDQMVIVEISRGRPMRQMKCCSRQLDTFGYRKTVQICCILGRQKGVVPLSGGDRCFMHSRSTAAINAVTQGVIVVASNNPERPLSYPVNNLAWLGTVVHQIA